MNILLWHHPTSKPKPRYSQEPLPHFTLTASDCDFVDWLVMLFLHQMKSLAGGRATVHAWSWTGICARLQTNINLLVSWDTPSQRSKNPKRDWPRVWSFSVMGRSSEQFSFGPQGNNRGSRSPRRPCCPRRPLTTILCTWRALLSVWSD